MTWFLGVPDVMNRIGQSYIKLVKSKWIEYLISFDGLKDFKLQTGWQHTYRLSSTLPAFAENDFQNWMTFEFENKVSMKGGNTFKWNLGGHNKI